MISIVFSTNAENNKIVETIDDWNDKNDYLYDINDNDPWEDQPSLDNLRDTDHQNGKKEVEDEPNDYGIDEEDDNKGKASPAEIYYIDKRLRESKAEKETNKPLVSQFWSEWLRASSSSQRPDSSIVTQSTTPVPQKANNSLPKNSMDAILDLFEEEAKRLPKEVKKN